MKTLFERIGNVCLGMKILIDGNIPLSAGLSSSSALVVCSALTTAIINGIHINKVCFFSGVTFSVIRSFSE